jgi:hypothetical protein
VGLAEAMSELKEFQGVSGPMSMNSQHELMRPLTPFMVNGDQIVTWTPELEQQRKKTTRK